MKSCVSVLLRGKRCTMQEQWLDELCECQCMSMLMVASAGKRFVSCTRSMCVYACLLLLSRTGLSMKCLGRLKHISESIRYAIPYATFPLYYFHFLSTSSHPTSCFLFHFLILLPTAWLLQYVLCMYVATSPPPPPPSPTIPITRTRHCLSSF